MSRRYGEGSIYKRADGRWAGTVELGDSENRRRRRVVYGDRRAEVVKKLEDLRHAVEAGATEPIERMTVERFLDKWLDAVRPTLRPRGYQSYESHVRLYLKPKIGRVPLRRLSPADVQQLLGELSATGLSPQTVVHVRATLRRALSYAERWSMVPRNVARLVDPPRVEEYRVDPMTSEQARHFLTHIRGHRLYSLFLFALTTGARQGEILAVTWDAIDWTKGEVSIRRSLQRVDGRMQPVETKTKRSRRVVPLTATTLEVLREQQKRQYAEGTVSDTGLVFTTTVGTPLNGPDLTRTFQALLEDAGLPRWRFHDLRHSAASIWIANGVPLRVVMELLGHSTIKVTADTYAHVVSELTRDAADRMESALG